MKKLKAKILSILLLITGIILALTPYQLFKICVAVDPSARNPFGGHMKCYYSAKLFIWTGILLIVFSLLTIIFNKKWLIVITSFVAMAVAIFDYMLPMGIIKVGNVKQLGWEIGMCSSPDMACLQNTVPAIRIILPIILFLGIFLLIKAFLSKSR